MTQEVTAVSWKTELQKVVELFSSKTFPETCAKVVINSPMKPCTRWSFGNQLLMLLAGTEDARGFRQWQEVNRWVRKGSRAFYILGPVIKKKEVEDEETHEVREEEFLAGFKTIPVFRFEDTEGKDLPVYKPAEIPPLYHVAEKWGYAVKYERLFNANGQIDYGAKVITLQTEEWDTFFHELGHAADKGQQHQELTGQSAEAETVADLTAATISRLYGRPVDDFRWNHIAMYAGEKSPEAVGRLCLKVLQRTQRALNLILEAQASTRGNMEATRLKLRFINGAKQQFESSASLTPQFLSFCNIFRRDFKTYLEVAFGATNIEIHRGHFELSGFFTQNQQVWYFSTGDLRWATKSLGLLLRTAKDYKDYTGGHNNTVRLDSDEVFHEDMRRILLG